MADIKWIKLSTDIFDNRKIKLIEKMPDGDSLIVIWLKLMCLAGTVNDSGLVYLTREVPYNDEMLSAIFDRPLTTVRLALQTFERFDMIEIVNDILMLPSWEKYQNTDGLEKVRVQTRDRVAKHRETQKLLACNVTSNADVTRGNGTDKELDKDKEQEYIGEKSARFIPPTLEEVEAYCKERDKGVDTDRWFNFYTAKNWMIGKNKMKDWKAAVRTWENKEDKPVEQPKPKPKKYREVVVNGETVLEVIPDA